MAQRVLFSQMTPDEMRRWLHDTRLALQRKMQREQAYLHRRARQGVHTPTDDAYEADQELEADLLALLEELEQHLEAGSW